MFDLNSAETGGGGPGAGLIPDGTVARAVLTIRPGGSGEGGWLKTSAAGGLMIDTEWTIADGPFAKRKVWRYMSLSENAAPITMKQLRAAIEGHHGIKPDDMSEAAQAKRRVSLDQLSGIEACILIGVEAAKDGYEAKNTIKAVLAPGESKYIGRGGSPMLAGPTGAGNVATFQAPPAASYAPPPPAAPAGAAKPAWAV
jgi:hypothetical protein